MRVRRSDDNSRRKVQNVRGDSSATGRTIWVQEPFEGDTLLGDSTRGVAYRSDRRDARVLVQRGEYLYALNARTGRTYPDFGERGRIDLNVGLGPLMSNFRWTDAPLVVRDVVLLGASMTDYPGPPSGGNAVTAVGALDVLQPRVSLS